MTHLRWTAGFILLASAAYCRADEPGSSRALAGHNTAFAIDLYGALEETEGNIVISPVSVSAGLGMVYAGARASTADEMAKTLHLPPADSGVHAQFAQLLQQIRDDAERAATELAIVNAAWVDKKILVTPEYRGLVESQYQAGLTTLDFFTDKEKTRQTINGWVAGQTRDKIAELLKPEVIKQDTGLVLTNAVYFKAKWAAPFMKEDTAVAPFHAAAGDVRASFMHRQGEYSYVEHEGCQVLEMPYAGEVQSMLVILPSSVDQMGALVKRLSPAWLDGATGLLERRSVRLALPRFEARTSRRLDDSLKRLGMPTAFSEREADFSGIDPRDILFLSAVAHEAYIEVNEEGTTATAATGAVLTKRSRPAGPPVEFRADHPFVYLIRHNPTGTILFLGRLVEPK